MVASHERETLFILVDLDLFLRSTAVKWWYSASFFIRPSKTRAYYVMALSVRPSVRRPSSVVRRPSWIFWLLHDKVRNSLPINFILSIWVYGHKTQAKFKDGHRPIQDGRLAAILVVS